MRDRIAPASLDPTLAEIIEETWGAAAHATAAPLSAGITNRNFRVEVGGESFVVRIPGRDTDLLGIDRERERRASEVAADAGVGPPVFTFLPERECLVTRFVPGAPIPPEDLERREVLARVVESVRALHGSQEIPGTFSAFRVVEEYRDVAETAGVAIPAVYSLLGERAGEIEETFAAAPTPDRPCHDDLLNANFLLDGDHVWIVDYEYAGMGDLFFDLGNLAVNNGLSEDAQRMLLELYFDDVTPSREARLKLMRIMSDFREGMWGVVQQGISTLDFDYVDYANRHLERCRAATEDERFGTWLTEARAAV